MDNLLDNQIIRAALILFIILYGLNLSKIKLPPYIKDLFNNTIFKIAFLSLLLMTNLKKDPHVAIIVSIVFVLTLEYLNNEEIKENFVYLESLIKK
jgi:hypothetical protein